MIRISTTTRAGDREVVRVRPFVRVASNLSLTVSELSANVPKFNPARLLMDNGRGNAVAADETPGAEPDAEVSFVTRDLAEHPAAREDRGLRFRARTSSRMCATSRPGPAAVRAGRSPRASHDRQHRRRQRMAYAAEGDIDPYAGFEARIVPENITLLPKSAGQDQCARMPGTSASSR